MIGSGDWLLGERERAGLGSSLFASEGTRFVVLWGLLIHP